MSKGTENPSRTGTVINEEIRDGMTVGPKQLARHRSPGKRNYDFQQIEGDDLHRATGRWSWINWVIDHVAKRYRKLIIDTETGEVLRDEDKPLDEHRGHGSARNKK